MKRYGQGRVGMRPDNNGAWCSYEDAQKAIACAVKAEREACAKIVDVADGAQAWEIRGGEEVIELLRDMAAAIRAR